MPLVLQPNINLQNNNEGIKDLYADFVKRYPSVKNGFKKLLMSGLAVALPVNYLGRGLTLECKDVHSFAEAKVVKAIRKLKEKSRGIKLIKN